MYSFGFLLALIGLGLWFYYQDKTQSPLMRLMFLIGLSIYAYSVFSAKASIDFKLGIAFRDILLMGTASLLYSVLLRTRKSSFLVGLVAIVGGVYFLYNNVWSNSFPQKNEDSSSESTAQSNSLAKNGELLVEIKNGHKIGDLKKLIKKYELKYERAFFPKRQKETDLDDYFFIDIPENRLSDIKKIESELANSGLTDWIEENEIIQLEQPASNGSNVSFTLGKALMNDPDVNNQWGFEKMRIDKLYTILKSSGIVPQKRALIAILDTGVAGNHEDLRENFHSLDSKYDNDPIGHGTHCAGIAAAVSNNNIGIASFAPDNQFVKVTSVKVLNPAGSGTQGKIIKGITLAADSGADVISLSLGGLSSRLRQRAYKQAVEYANQAGAIVVVAAGNSNSNSKNYAPANTPGVITVSAIDTTINRAHFSNTIQDLKMGIAAPGVKIYSTIPNNRYAFFNGTSMATPYVSGLIGMMKSIHPKLTTRQVYEILDNTGIETNQTNLTGKFIQPAAAIEALID